MLSVGSDGGMHVRGYAVALSAWLELAFDLLTTLAVEPASSIVASLV
jgi:hypothetical protein